MWLAVGVGDRQHTAGRGIIGVGDIDRAGAEPVLDGRQVDRVVRWTAPRSIRRSRCINLKVGAVAVERDRLRDRALDLERRADIDGDRAGAGQRAEQRQSPVWTSMVPVLVMAPEIDAVPQLSMVA